MIRPIVSSSSMRAACTSSSSSGRSRSSIRTLTGLPATSLSASARRSPFTGSSILRLLNEADCGYSSTSSSSASAAGPRVGEQRGEHLAALALPHALEHGRPERLDPDDGLVRHAARGTAATRLRAAATSAAGFAGLGDELRRPLRPAPRSSCSIRSRSASTEASARGLAAFSSATSSWMRASEPSLTAASASATGRSRESPRPAGAPGPAPPAGPSGPRSR